MKVIKASVDRDGCISCGLCINLCPHVFQMADDDKAMAINEIVPEEFTQCAQEAEESCPVAVIRVTEEDA